MAVPKSGTYTFSIYALQDGHLVSSESAGVRLRYRIDEDTNYSWKKHSQLLLKTTFCILWMIVALLTRSLRT